jgi:hypothetical protein
MSLTTHNVKKLNSEEVAYVYYTLPDLTLITKCSTQAMPLLLEVTTVLDHAKLASEKAFNEMIAQEIRIEKLNSEKNEALASVDKQEDVIIKLTKELEDAKSLINSSHLDTNSDTADALSNARGENEKLKFTLSESTTKLEQAGAHFKTQLKQITSEANQAREAEAEIREEIQKLKDTNKRLVYLAEKATHSLDEFKKSVSFSSASSTTSSIKQSDHQIQADKLEETFKRVMSIGVGQRKATSITSEIILDDEEDMTYTARNSHQFKIKMDSTLPTFNGNPDSNVNEWLHSIMRILDACTYPGKEKVLLASNSLKELALQDYLIRERTVGKDTWASFIEYMRLKYTPPNHNQMIRVRMKALHQITSVKDYYMDFRMLSIQTDDMTDATRLGMFLDNLKPELSSYCYLNQVKTLDEAYNIALLKETYCADKESTINTASVYFTNQSSARPEAQLPLKAKNNNRYRNEICCICQQVGHIGEHCRN